MSKSTVPAKLVISILFAAVSAYAQFPLSVGIKGGVGLTDAFQNASLSDFGYSFQSYSDSKDYIVGPFVELRLPFGFAAEVDALYRPLSLATIASAPDGTLIKSSQRYATWEISTLAKYRFRRIPIVKPFVSVGPTFRAEASDINYLSNVGISAGGGADIKLLFLKISPELRYTHWGSDSNGAYVSSSFGPSYRSNQNQAELLVGISF